MKCRVVTLLIAFELLSTGSLLALPTEFHGLIAREAFYLPDIPAEIGLKIGKIRWGATLEDDGREPWPPWAPDDESWLDWGSHFWNPEEGSNGGHLGVFNRSGENAYQRAQRLYDEAVTDYATNPEAAYVKLGRVAHLLQDMSVPAHVHLDIHIPWPASEATPYGHDPYEAYIHYYRSDFGGDTEVQGFLKRTLGNDYRKTLELIPKPQGNAGS